MSAVAFFGSEIKKYNMKSSAKQGEICLGWIVHDSDDKLNNKNSMTKFEKVKKFLFVANF